MESVVIDRPFWQGRRVFVTGHTGFKGAWLSLLLHRLGAAVSGYSHEVPDEGLFRAAGVEDVLARHVVADVRDLPGLRDAMHAARPQIVVHMAAQSLVRASYADPAGTYATNLMGTVNVLEAARHLDGVSALIVVTSDKCYEDAGDRAAHRETDRLGGDDPYSSSKACAELAAASYRSSFASSRATVATVRAGNVIGGGDWARDRLVPDAIRACRAGRELAIRNPDAIRPWQHVLDPLCGYLMLAERVSRGDGSCCEAWNFGPPARSHVTVGRFATELARRWGADARWTVQSGPEPRESAYLALDSGKAERRLGWRPRFGLEDALDMTVAWYQSFFRQADVRATTLDQIDLLLEGASAPTGQGRE